MENNSQVLNIKAVLNVGLCSDRDGTALRRISPVYSESMRLATWYRFAKQAGGLVALQDSASEPTLIITLDMLPPYSLSTLVEDTDQHCIAVYYPSLYKGCMIGPRPDKFGPFLREFFVMPNGSRLSDLDWLHY